LRVHFYALTIALLACSQPVQTSAATSSQSKETKATTATAAKPAVQEKTMTDTQEKVAEIHTTAGDIVISFRPDKAPNHVKNFIELAQSGFYNGTKFHRVIPGFMIQGGDPNTKTADVSTWGTGGSGKNVKAEFNDLPHVRGTVSMARSQSPDSASSQFFICVADARFLDHQYSAFGQVLKGMDVADKIVSAPRGAQDRPNNPVAITSITIRPMTAADKGSAAKQ
jgi:peptidyl-prolyl cis-trans isomerase B (cyclophilin B)